MWTCSKCNRSFKNINQSHYCGDFKTIDEYIEHSPEEHRDILRRVRETIRSVMPEATEKLSWKMPTFWQEKNLIQFAVHKNHLGLYPGPEAVKEFASQIEKEGFKSNKGVIQLPWNKPIPYELIKAIALYCVQSF
ncbi:MAG: DUF1801 domain-containing protein [Spirochaetaceae bacterium]|nr:DUF1801 domain-containing protein [Spirochaetaceae bacterium]